MLKKGTASAEQVTLSFWTKSDKTGTYIVVLYDDDNARSVSAAYTVASSGTWERQSVTFPGDTTGAFVNDSGPSLSVEWWLAAGSSFTTGTLATTWGAAAGNRAVGQTNLAAATNYWQITGAQLEVGATASKFQFRPYDQDLSDCQRYYQIIPVGTYAATGTCYDSSASIIYSFPFAVQMRASGTLATAITTSGLKTTNSSGVSTNTNAIIATYCTPTQCTPIATVTGSSYGDARVGYVATAINVTADL
jgi:hypothetical protein